MSWKTATNAKIQSAASFVYTWVLTDFPRELVKYSAWNAGMHLSKIYNLSRNVSLLSLTLDPPNWPPTCLKSLKGTNWTMSRRTGSPFGERRIPSSPSSICMSVKSAFPTPTMMTDMGRWEACTMASRVSAMSVMTPSVRISRMKYSCGTGRNLWVEGKRRGEGGRNTCAMNFMF